jgi:UDP:flavonoid glycosyltransferase YjiC (YdhE family)
MRVLFVTWALSPHYRPLVPLGWALRAAGHQVLVASHPSFAPVIAASGLPALPAGPAIDLDAEIRAEAQAGRWFDEDTLTPQQIRQRRTALTGLHAPLHSAEAMAGDLITYARTWHPDLVIYEPTAFAGPLVARLLAIPAVRHLWTADFTAPLHLLEHQLLGPLFDRYGATRIGILGDLTLDPCPPRLQITDTLPRQPIRYIPYNGPAVCPPWLRRPPGRPRICVTWGTSLTGIGGPDRIAHVPRILTALAGLDADIILAVLDTHRATFTHPPANVTHIGPVPLHLLLPTCQAIIHQGGGGTLMTAMTAGLPQLIIPTIQDETFNARQLAATGAGLHLTGGETITPHAVTHAATALLTDPAYTTAARQLAAEARTMPAPADIIPALHHLTTHPTPTPTPAR